jgi:hypothetical protein
MLRGCPKPAPPPAGYRRAKATEEFPSAARPPNVGSADPVSARRFGMHEKADYKRITVAIDELSAGPARREISWCPPALCRAWRTRMFRTEQPRGPIARGDVWYPCL